MSCSVFTGLLLTAVSGFLFLYPNERLSEKSRKFIYYAVSAGIIVVRYIVMGLLLAGITVVPVVMAIKIAEEIRNSESKNELCRIAYHYGLPSALFLLAELLTTIKRISLFDMLFFGASAAFRHTIKYNYSVQFWILGVLFTYLCITLLRILFNNKVGSIIGIVLFAVFAITNYCVTSITGQPFLPSDIHLAATAFSVLGEVHLTFRNWTCLFISIIFVAAFIVGAIIFEKNKKWSSRAVRIFDVLEYTAFAALIIFSMNLQRKQVLLFDGVNRYSVVTNFLLELDYKLHFPADVDLFLPEPDKDTESDFKPNVIIIMNEAFSDLSATFGLETDKDPLTYFHALCEQYPHGITYSSVRGNNTCSSEWEAISGVSTGLTEKGAVIFQTHCIPMQSLVSAFNARGYSTLGLHPYFHSGYNRKRFYDALGFQKTIFSEDLGEEIEKVRNFISDKADYETLITEFENREKDTPFFCLNVTMQDHAGYKDDGGLEEKIEVDWNDDEFGSLHNYLTLLNESDNALHTLIEYFDSVEEPTVILFFGDHQPMLDTDFYKQYFGKDFEELTPVELEKVYEIPYLIWSNFPINTEELRERTSNNYLSSMLFGAAGIEKTAWMKKMDEAEAAFPIITANFTEAADGTVYSTEALLTDTEVNTEKLIQYQKYCYGILAGKSSN